MAPQLTHAEIQELLGAYALDAVEPTEAEAVEAHLPGCPRCRAEVAEHREAATLLSFSGAAAPADVWSRIAAGLEEAPPPFALPTPIRPRRPPRRFVTAVAAVAAVAAAIIGVLSVHVVQQDQRIDRLAALSDRHGLDQAAAAAALTVGARTVHLTSNDGAATADAVVLPDGYGYLVQAKLPTVTSDRTYQLWGLMGTQMVSLGVLGDQPTISSFRAVGPLSALAITAEHDGGAVAPTQAPIVQGFVRT